MPEGVDRSVTLLLGMGNPILADDAVGLVVARQIYKKLPPGTAELVEASVGGLELLDVLQGRQRVSIVDSLQPGLASPGELVELDVTAMGGEQHTLTPHRAGLQHCLELGRMCGLTMPDQVLVFGIGVRDTRTFSESLTPEVRASVSGIADVLVREVFGPGGRFNRL